MFEYINKLRKKPDAQKRRFVFLFAAGVTLVIASFWTVATVFKIQNGSLSFEVNVPLDDGSRSFSKELEESWGRFFPEDEEVLATSTATSSEPEAESGVSDYPALEVLFGEPEVVEGEQEPVYPADVYSN